MEDACCAFKTTTCGLTYFHRRQVRGDMTDTKKKKNKWYREDTSGIPP